MRRDRIDFKTFKKNFVEEFGGWFPVHSSIHEDERGNFHQIVEMDMIVEWRLDDGKVRFIEVPYETEEEYQEIKGYLKVAADLLHKVILENIDGLEEYRNEKREQHE